MAEKLTLQALQAFVNTKDKVLETMAIYDTRFELVSNVDDGILRITDEDSEGDYCIIYGFRSAGGEVFTFVKQKPMSSGDNREGTAEHKVSAVLQVFSSWAKTQDTYHEFMEKAGKKRNRKNRFDETGFIDSWQLTDKDETEQFHSVYKGNLIAYSTFIAEAVLADEEIKTEDKTEFLDAIKHFQYEVDNEPKAKVVRSLGKVMSWVKERSKKALNTVMNEAGKYLMKKGFELVEGKVPQVIAWLENTYTNN